MKELLDEVLVFAGVDEIDPGMVMVVEGEVVVGKDVSCEIK